MLKYVLCFSVCLFALAMPSFADLTQQDLNEIRLIVKEEIEKVIKEEINPIKVEIASVKGEVAQVQRELDRFGRNIIWFIIIFAVAGIIPQRIVAWRKRRLRLQEEQIQKKKNQAELITEIEKLKQQRIVNP